jgi:hypothetical protein
LLASAHPMKHVFVATARALIPQMSCSAWLRFDTQNGTHPKVGRAQMSCRHDRGGDDESMVQLVRLGTHKKPPSTPQKIMLRRAAEIFGPRLGMAPFPYLDLSRLATVSRIVATVGLGSHLRSRRALELETGRYLPNSNKRDRVTGSNNADNRTSQSGSFRRGRRDAIAGNSSRMTEAMSAIQSTGPEAM